MRQPRARGLADMLWVIALGSAAGGVARFLFGAFVQQRTGGTFPLGTLLVNIIGAVLVGFIMRYALATPAVSAELRAALTTGFCGGFTTFSTFTFETLALVEDGEWKRAAVYVGLSIVLGLVGVYLGVSGARELLAFRQRA